MSERKCPACGLLLEGTPEKCSKCGLEGLNLRFLNKAGYMKWMQEVLEPHKASLGPQVFAGRCHGLILTNSGKLYGLGSNRSGQIEEEGFYDYNEPHLMATDVISAAAGRNYSIYVTRDGEVHLRGRGEIAERFTGFSNAEMVWMEYDIGWTRDEWKDDTFWILNRDGAVYGFGKNRFEPRRTRLWKRLEREECVVHYGVLERWESGHPLSILGGAHTSPYLTDWSDIYRESDMVILKSEDYRRAVQIFGGDRVYIERTAEQNVEIPVTKRYDEGYGPTGWNFAGETVRYTTAKRHSCIPEIRISNDVLYDPVLCPDHLWMKDTPHREGSMPIRPEEWENWEAPEAIRKLAGRNYRWLCLRENGRVLLSRSGAVEEELDWLPASVGDLAMSDGFVILSCGNGEILWSKDQRDVENGRMNVTWLPGDGS